jgi:hypothetical protein
MVTIGASSAAILAAIIITFVLCATAIHGSMLLMRVLRVALAVFGIRIDE